MHSIYQGERFDGKRILIAENEITLALYLTSAVIRLGGTVVGPTATLPETRALIWKAKPDIVVLGPFLSDLELTLFTIERFERHVPVLFYIKVPQPRPILVLRGNATFAQSTPETELLPAMAAVLRPRWPARPLEEMDSRLTAEALVSAALRRSAVACASAGDLHSG